MNNILRVAFSTLSTDTSRYTSLLSISLVTEENSKFYAEINVKDCNYDNYKHDLLFSDTNMKSIKSYKDFKSPKYDMYMKDDLVYVSRVLSVWLENESKCSNSKIKFYTCNYNPDDSYNYNSVLLIDLLRKYSFDQTVQSFIIPRHEEVVCLDTDGISLNPEFNLMVDNISAIRKSHKIKSLMI